MVCRFAALFLVSMATVVCAGELAPPQERIISHTGEVHFKTRTSAQTGFNQLLIRNEVCNLHETGLIYNWDGGPSRSKDGVPLYASDPCDEQDTELVAESNLLLDMRSPVTSLAEGSTRSTTNHDTVVRYVDAIDISTVELIKDRLMNSIRTKVLGTNSQPRFVTVFLVVFSDEDSIDYLIEINPAPQHFAVEIPNIGVDELREQVSGWGYEIENVPLRDLASERDQEWFSEDLLNAKVFHFIPGDDVQTQAEAARIQFGYQASVNSIARHAFALVSDDRRIQYLSTIKALR